MKKFCESMIFFYLSNILIKYILEHTNLDIIKKGKVDVPKLSEILAYYFKPEKIEPYVLLSYKKVKGGHKIVLEGVKFIKNEKKAKSFISNHNISVEACEPILGVKEVIEEYLSGKKSSLFRKVNGLDVDLALPDKFPTNFSQKVIEIVSTLKHGETISYSGIGEKIDSRAYQAIGNIMAKNPLPLIIPCHRVIKKSGELGGFMGKTEETWQKTLKEELITLEGLKK